MKAAEPSGRGARPVPKEAAEHRPGRGSFGISFRATRGTARPRAAAAGPPRTGRWGTSAVRTFLFLRASAAGIGC